MKPTSVASICLAIVLMTTGAAIILRLALEMRHPLANPTAPFSYGKLPLRFEPNYGQVDPRVDYLAVGSGYKLFLAPSEATFLMRREPVAGETAATAILRLTLLGANPVTPGAALDELPGRMNYLLGNDRTKWRRDIPTYGKVRYKDVYPGIDLVYYGNHQQLEYDFVVAPKVDPGAISLQFAGSDKLRIDERGDLVIALGDSEVRFRRPLAYQTSAESKQQVAVGYKLNSDNLVSFSVGDYDHSRMLVIDPILAYSTFIGGSSVEGANGIAVDRAGNAYIVGTSLSSDYPVTAGAFSSASPGIVVSKLNRTGSALVYSTFVGGSAIGFGDQGLAIAVDPAGQAIITGDTISRDFPTTANAFDRTCGTDGMCNQDLFGVNGDTFLTVLNASGSDLVYSTYFGGIDLDFGRAVRIDASGKIYLAGYSLSEDLPTTGAAQVTCGGGTFLRCTDGFIAKFNTSVSGADSLLYATYLGGNGDDIVQGIAVDSDGNAYVTGQTISTNFPTSAGAFDRTCGDDGRCDDINSVSAGPDAFVTKIAPTGGSFLYSTYLGANGHDIGAGIAVDNRGGAYVTGLTQSTDFPTTNRAFSRRIRGIEDVFVTIMNVTGSRPLASTYLGSSGEDTGSAIAVDPQGNAYITGTTDFDDFPITPDGAFGFSGGEDAFVTKFDNRLSVLVHSTYLGGSQDDLGKGLALWRNFTFVAGFTHSANFPTTPGAFDRICGTAPRCNNDQDDVFVSKLILPRTATLFPEAQLSNDFLIFGAQNVGTTSEPQTVILSSIGDGPLEINSITAAGDFTQTNNCPSSLAPGARCQISVTFTPTQTGSRVGSITIVDNAEDSPQVINTNGTGVSNPRADLSPGDLDFANVEIGTQSEPLIERVY